MFYRIYIISPSRCSCPVFLPVFLTFPFVLTLLCSHTRTHSLLFNINYRYHTQPSTSDLEPTNTTSNPPITPRKPTTTTPTMPPKKRLQADPDSSGDDITLQPPLPKRHTGADRAQNTPRDRPLNSRAISIDLTKPPPPPASPYAKNMRNDENDFQFNVLLSPKFKAFPDAVGKEVLRSYMETIKALMECLKSGR